MSSFVFHVTERTESPTKLRGTCSAPGFNLRVLTIDPTTVPVPDRTIKKANTLDKINVTSTEFDTLDTMSLPNDVTFTGTESATDFVVSSIQVGGGLAPAIRHLESDVHELAGTAAAIDERLAHDLSGDIIGELRKLNRRVESIERLLIESREQRELAATGTDRR